ncbi:MAG: alpha-ketoglutarate-dependent dioxygenase AlkB [Cytophagaceae bacterium]|jgi:alkylated DNA repair dioxygenase AlkB|nr:alpha-ketoglutarate-dependent dioxygenase AlkB [Cytophagaceae bacterium]
MKTIPKSKNLLPYDGEVFLIPDFLSITEADTYFKHVEKELSWVPDKVILYGKEITTKRTMVWMSDSMKSYTYSGVKKDIVSFTSLLNELKESLIRVTDTPFNSCLANRYANGSEGMSWHTDNEKELVAFATIASISLGAERRFDFRHKITNETISLQLPHGSLLIMKGVVQQYWKHQLPIQKKVQGVRVNLTYRQMK